jgi:hypothetical protein
MPLGCSTKYQSLFREPFVRAIAGGAIFAI